jgi:hypothetical protein
MTLPIENYFALTTRILKKTFKKARNLEPVEEEYLNFRENRKETVPFYSLRRDFEDNLYLEVNFTGKY